jgi:hypothetical protein
MLWAQQDGNLVLYRNSDAKPTWSSGTAGRHQYPTGQRELRAGSTALGSRLSKLP